MKHNNTIINKRALAELIKGALTVLISVFLIFTVAKASTSTFTAPTGEPSAKYYTLTEIYNLIANNTSATEGTHDFTFADSLAGTHYSLTDIYSALSSLIDATKVLTGTTYLGTAGTMANNGAFALTASSTNQSVTAGYYSGGTLVGDADLSVANIASGIDIFGVTGTLTPESGAVTGLTATNASCGQTYFGSGASSWTPSSGTLCHGICTACSGGSCVNADSGTDEYGDCGGASCCGYCDGSGGCAYKTAGATCDTPGTACNGSYKCDGAGSCGLWACGDPIEHEGESYTTVYIGTQCWFAENLNIGTRIAGAGNQTNNSIIEKYCYSDQESYCDTEGGLYQWDEAMSYSTTPGVQGLCPSGWHIPTHDEFTTLELAVCTSGSCVTDFPYDTLTTGWRGTNEGTKLKSGGTSGFNALLAGCRSTDGAFYYHGAGGYFWSSLEIGSSAWRRNLNSDFAAVNRYTVSKAYGFSVRCLKD